MKEKNERHTRRVRNLVILFVLLAVFIAVSTYAWFIGMRTVNVATFDVEIAGIDGLMLSLNGEDWSETVHIDKDNFDNVSVVYPDHTNSWAGYGNVISSVQNPGLIPMSSIGEMDEPASRMKLFEKASMTATPGGYRLLASRMDNFSWRYDSVGAPLTTNPTPEAEPTGYVVFDLFIKNLSGTQYIDTLDKADEEAIFLTVNSEVVVSPTLGVPNTGIENSVRVGFAQIGRVIGTAGNIPIADPNYANEIAAITSLSCNDAAGTIVTHTASGLDQTGICRIAQIWEPNDTHHVSSAINWYDTSCRVRTAANITLSASYDLTYPGTGQCEQLTNGIYYPTYAVLDEIEASDWIDVYDGPVYNTWANTINTGSNPTGLLYEYPTFTDTQKNYRSTNREAFMTLAPNSITKVRIYIWIEGQDIDNYDFAAIGKAVLINFGFTKERFTEEDINYTGPIINQGLGPTGADLTPPIITLLDPKSASAEFAPIINPTTSVSLGDADWKAAMDDTDHYGDVQAALFSAVVTATSDDPRGDLTPHDMTTYMKWTGHVNVDVAGTYQITFIAPDDSGNIATKVLTVVVS